MKPEEQVLGKDTVVIEEFPGCPPRPPLPTDAKRKEWFLAEYKTICERYSMIIWACGCCNSPWTEVADKEQIEDSIKHLTKDGE